MSKVTECARALGQAIVDSEEYKNMQVTESAATADPAVAKAMERYLELKQELDGAMAGGDPDMIARYGREMDDLQQTMNQMPVIENMTLARQRFSEIMNQVNTILEFMITGEVATGGGCSGNCGGCSGCH